MSAVVAAGWWADNNLVVIKSSLSRPTCDCLCDHHSDTLVLSTLSDTPNSGTLVIVADRLGSHVLATSKVCLHGKDTQTSQENNSKKHQFIHSTIHKLTINYKPMPPNCTCSNDSLICKIKRPGPHISPMLHIR
jgi:hypothetical protein